MKNQKREKKEEEIRKVSVDRVVRSVLCILKFGGVHFVREEVRKKGKINEMYLVSKAGKLKSLLDKKIVIWSVDNIKTESKKKKVVGISFGPFLLLY